MPSANYSAGRDPALFPAHLRPGFSRRVPAMRKINFEGFLPGHRIIFQQFFSQIFYTPTCARMPCSASFDARGLDGRSVIPRRENRPPMRRTATEAALRGAIGRRLDVAIITRGEERGDRPNRCAEFCALPE
ncbi:MAG TPA: hypothetical protein VIO10_03965 [Candidatus Binatus sp.]